jgi:hypothetical protein
MNGIIIIPERNFCFRQKQKMKKHFPLCFLIVTVINAACIGTIMPVTNMPFATPKALGPTPSDAPQILQPTPISDPSNYGGIEINGNSEFVTQTRAALTLLEQKAPGAFKKIQTYIGIIEQGEHSGMWAWENPPLYEVGDATAFFSVTWYASTIAHDATHSELFAQYQAAHPNQPVPENAYGGVEIERFCIGYQLEVSKLIEAPQSEIDYLSTLDGTHCDIDHDGDCDWDDYRNRNW